MKPKPRLLIALAFNPDEPRDDRGRWTEFTGKRPQYGEEGPEAPHGLTPASNYSIVGDGKPVQMMIPIDKVRSDPGQPIVKKNTVGRYLYESRIGESHDAVTVVQHSNGEYHIADGHHRVVAARAAGKKHILADVEQANPLLADAESRAKK